MDINNNCKNCNYYKAHYMKGDNGRFYELNNGHCTNPRVKISSFRRGFKMNCACPYWQLLQNKDQEPNIDDIIKKMATRIEQIATFLKIN